MWMLHSEMIQVEVKDVVIFDILASNKIRKYSLVLLLSVGLFNIHGANLIITLSQLIYLISTKWRYFELRITRFKNQNKTEGAQPGKQYQINQILMKQVSLIGKKLVEETFNKQRILVNLGSKILKVGHGEVELWLPKTEMCLQHHGFIHGGIVTTLADTAAGLSGFSVLDNPEHTCITVELKINFIKPADSDVTALGKIIKQNKSLMVTSAEVLNSEGKLCAYMLQTIKRIRPGDLVKNS